MINMDVGISKNNKTTTNLNNSWKLVWYDEFNGTKLNKEYWSFQSGGDGWGNNELQYYTDRKENCYVENGKLIIRAMNESFENNQFTSARIMTKGKVDFLYGRIDIKARLPKGKGLLPAFWLLSSEDNYQDRRKNGEIDIMEMLGANPKVIYAVAHYSLNEEYKSWGKYENNSIDFSKDFHIYSLEWNRRELKWFIDDKIYYILELDKVFNEEYHPFSKRFYLIMNIAIGGDWPGNDLSETIFPTQMEIDYVKYYRK
jgi:beta-glucanase (GH16 family)